MVEKCPDRPLLVFDGACSFCRAWVEYWKQLTSDRVLYAPYQEIGDRFPSIAQSEFAVAVHLILPDGEKFTGAHAVFRLLALLPGRSSWLRLYEHVPGVALVSEAAYRVIAQHRSFAYQVTKILWGIPAVPETFNYASWIFIRLLGLIYLIAFLSFGVQARGLIGSHGISPVADFLHAARDYFAFARFWNVPTLLWLNSSDGMLRAIWLAGSFLALLQFGGLNWRWIRVAVFILYLSLVAAGQQFMGYQWDALLLEAGFLAIFLGSSPLIIKLLRWLLFRLVFLSGAVKLLSHDPLWRSFSALPVHYETQPLPTPIAWHFYHLPAWFQHASVGFVFLVELVIPFFILAPRRLRVPAVFAIALLQILIALTGNYAFFNLLTLALCLFLLDDHFLRHFSPERVLTGIAHGFAPRSGKSWARQLCAVVYVVILLVSGFEMATTFSGLHWKPADKIMSALGPLQIVNTYGLFAVMTTTRPEIIVQGSNDGASWLSYEFKYKPGDLERRPPWVAPHQPRLDWQMWFAALGDYHSDPWILHFMARLLEGSPDVLRLLERNPFPNAPPRYLRAVVYQYNFTTPAERKLTGNWWRRELKGEYVPVISLQR